MTAKLFGNKKIMINGLSQKDLKDAKEFVVFINSLVEEDAKILMDKKMTMKEEKEFLKSNIKNVRNKKRVYLIARDGKKIVGNTHIEQERYKSNHIGTFAVAIAQGYRGIGLGNYLMSEIIKFAKRGFNPKLKIIQLRVYKNNKPAINLYKKMGFKIVAKIPKQVRHKGKLIDEFIMLKYL